MVLIKRGQMYSYDVLIAVAVFIFGFVAFYILVGSSGTNSKAAELTTEGGIIAGGTDLGKGPKNISFVVNDEVSSARYIKFANLSYEDTKSQLGLKNDFCMHFEDKDGNLISVEGIRSVGSDRINLSINNEIVQCNSS